MWALVPLKCSRHAKTRLADVLRDEERRDLALVMLRDVLRVLQPVRGLSGLLVVTADEEGGRLARAFGAEVLPDRDQSGLNPAVTLGAARLEGRTEGIMVVPADVPLATTGELERLLECHDPPPALTIVSDREGEGSNCLVCSPPRLIPFAYGGKSFRRHVSAARAAGVEARVLELEGLALDIDTQGDLHALLETPGQTATHRYLEESGLRARLSRTGPELGATIESGGEA